jgi:hypothetical protein
MIIINKNSNNTFQLTLTENITLSSPNYLFEFKSDISNESVCFIASDTSAYQERYNEFTVTETSGTNILTSGTITLEPMGLWTYRVFEQTSSTNLNPSLADSTTPLEIGKVRVKGNSTVDWDFYDGDNITFDVNE